MLDKIKHLKTILSNVWIQFLLFVSGVWLLFVHLEINRHIKDRIIGFHYWRKSDTYAQITNYYYNGLNFFDHSIYYNQLNSGGKALAEFPLFYYLIAFQQTLFGPHEIIAKINWIVLLMVGLFSLFQISQHYLKHWLFSLIIALSFFISPIYTIYSIDFLPDPAAMYFLFVGMWLLLRHTQNQKNKSLIGSLIFIAIAGMMKPFFLIPYLAILLTILFNQLFLKISSVKFKLSYLVPVLATIGWFLYVNLYNKAVNSDYFLSNTRAFWEFSATENLITLEAIRVHWLADYLHPDFQITFLILIIINLAWWTKKTLLINIFYLFSFLGCIAFYMLFFNMFEHHDYYIYPTLFFLPLTLGKFIYHLSQTIKSTTVINVISILVFGLFMIALENTFNRMQHRRGDDFLNGKYFFENYEGTDSFLSRNGIEKDDLVIAFSDKSPSFALSLMKRKGWSGYQTYSGLMPIDSLMAKGADFLIVNEREFKVRDSIYIQDFKDYPIADTNKIFIYDLRPYRQ
ncbi:ArnT family glycosyltransferase [Crocinitomix algicola]|uniref:ArnT family glycosyltransferase n=1 Tax=Crocinitomix algicola TaxID=1740263 RepID=UPI00082C485D|nr:glycosyltransferase family 39 protein [Crocinitomix algicola]